MHRSQALLSVAALLLTSAIGSQAEASITFGIFGDSAPQAQAIVNAQGNSATVLSTLTTSDLASIDVLWALNGSNSFQLSPLGSPQVESFVSNGGVLLYHDREVGNAESVLPGGGGFNILRETGNDDINILTNSTLVTNGPGGVVTNTNLDQGNSSSHGFAVSGSLPGSSLSILSRTDPNQIVDFTYEFGLGDVYYSTIPLDFYLGGVTGDPDFQFVYAPNVVAFAAELATATPDPDPGPGAAPEPTMLVIWSGLACCCGVATKRRR